MTNLTNWWDLLDIAERNGYERKRNYVQNMGKGIVSGDAIVVDSALGTILDPNFLYALFGDSPVGTGRWDENADEIMRPCWQHYGMQAIMCYWEGLNIVDYLHQEVTKKGAL